MNFINKFENHDIDEVYRCTNIYQDNIVQQLRSINELKAIVGVTTSFENKEIPIASVLAAGEYVQNNLTILKKVWNLDLRKNKISEEISVKSSMGVINQILTQWCFSEIVKSNRERKMVKGVRMDTSQCELRWEKEDSLINEHRILKPEIGSQIIEEPAEIDYLEEGVHS